MTTNNQINEHPDERAGLIETLRQDAQMLRSDDAENILVYSDGVADNIVAAAALLKADAQRQLDAATTTIRLTDTIMYLVGIAERGEGRKARADETAEQFVLDYVKKLEQRLALNPLTDEQIGVCIDSVNLNSIYGKHHFGWHLDFARAIESSHGIK